MKRWVKKLKNILFGFQGTLLYCSKCNSANVTFGETIIQEDTEIYEVRCKDCGATGIVKETWKE